MTTETVHAKTRHADALDKRLVIVHPASKARADCDIGAALFDRSGQLPDPGRVMLAVGVDHDAQVVPVAHTVQKSRLHRATVAEVDGERDHAGAQAGRNFRGGVTAAVVDDEQVVTRRGLANLGDDAWQVAGFVVGGHDDQPSRSKTHLQRIVAKGYHSLLWFHRVPGCHELGGRDHSVARRQRGKDVFVERPLRFPRLRQKAI